MASASRMDELKKALTTSPRLRAYVKPGRWLRQREFTSSGERRNAAYCFGTGSELIHQLSS